MPTAENAAAHDKSVELLGAARAQGRWTDEDALAMRQLMPQMTPAQREEVLSTLVPAFNRGDLKIEFAGMPF